MKAATQKNPKKTVQDRELHDNNEHVPNTTLKRVLGRKSSHPNMSMPRFMSVSVSATVTVSAPVSAR